MRCRACQGKLTEYMLGELPAAEQAAVRAHLESCAGCRERHEQLTRLDAMLPAVPLVEMERDLWPAVTARLRESQVVGPRPVVRLVTNWRPLTAMATAGAALALLLAVLTQPRVTVVTNGSVLGGWEGPSEMTMVWDDPWAGDAARALDWVLSEGAGEAS